MMKNVKEIYIYTLRNDTCKFMFEESKAHFDEAKFISVSKFYIPGIDYSFFFSMC